MERGKYIRTKKILEKMKKAQLGKKHSEKTKEKMSNNQPRRYGEQNPMWGKKHTDKSIKRQKQNQPKKYKDKNPMWKGDDVGYHALHAWVKRYCIKPKLCECCKKVKPMDLSNKGIYNRELKNWEWLCRKCHMLKDGRLRNFYKMAKRSKKGKSNPNWKGGRKV